MEFSFITCLPKFLTYHNKVRYCYFIFYKMFTNGKIKKEHIFELEIHLLYCEISKYVYNGVYIFVSITMNKCISESYLISIYSLNINANGTIFLYEI